MVVGASGPSRDCRAASCCGVPTGCPVCRHWRLTVEVLTPIRMGRWPCLAYEPRTAWSMTKSHSTVPAGLDDPRHPVQDCQPEIEELLHAAIKGLDAGRPRGKRRACNNPTAPCRTCRNEPGNEPRQIFRPHRALPSCSTVPRPGWRFQVVTQLAPPMAQVAAGHTSGRAARTHRECGKLGDFSPREYFSAHM